MSYRWMTLRPYPKIHVVQTLSTLFLLTGFFLLIEISFFIQCYQSYLIDYLFMSRDMTIPWSVLPGILYFIFAELIVHIGFTLFILYLSIYLCRLLQLRHGQLAFSIVLWGIGLVTILSGNQYLFPNSKFSELTMLALNHTMAHVLFFIGLAIITVCFLATLWIARWARNVSVFLCLSIGLFSFYPSLIYHDGSTIKRPNIILIGIDSLRPDFLGYLGHETRTPFLDVFLKESLFATDALTPLARTFPSWASILSGQYPKESGIRTNLSSPQKIDASGWLPAILRKEGYKTYYASDETRFSNMDPAFGFDEVITPPMGLNDFLLGTFNDFPLSNLIINTMVGRFLFPYSYGNRPAYFVYNPNAFLALIQSHLLQNRTKPVFLAIHFCLPHYPYLWADLSGRDYSPLERYQKSIERVDQQLNDFFSLLSKGQLLNHAIVVLLSDHGEALELPGDRLTEKERFTSSKHKRPTAFYQPGLDKEDFNQSVGHGTDVLGLTQYHTLLAIKTFGLPYQQSKMLYHPISLLSIKPTLLDLLGNQKTRSFMPRPRSLAPFIFGQSVVSAPEHFFFESDFTPDAVKTIYPNLHDVVLEGIELFDIDPITTHLFVKDKMNKMIIQSKQYGDLYGQD